MGKLAMSASTFQSAPIFQSVLMMLLPVPSLADPACEAAVTPHHVRQVPAVTLGQARIHYSTLALTCLSIPTAPRNARKRTIIRQHRPQLVQVDDGSTSSKCAGAGPDSIQVPTSARNVGERRLRTLICLGVVVQRQLSIETGLRCM